MMQFKTNLRVKGEVLLCKKVNGIDVPALPQFKNLILDAFIEAVYTNSLAFNFDRTSFTVSQIGNSFRIGAGSVAPEFTDTALQTPLRHSSNVSIFESSCSYSLAEDTYTMVRGVRCEFSAATVEENLSELAVYSNSAGTNLTGYPIISRTLIKDGLGAPTTLTLAIGEILVIYYTFTCVIPRTVTAEKIINGVPTTITMSYNRTSENSYTAFPFRRFDGPLGATSGNLAFRTTDFTIPSTYANFSFTGWIQENSSINSSTPIGLGTGLKQRSRINLNYANSPNVYGIHFKTSTGSTDNSGWIFKFNPPFAKTDQFVIDFESLTTITRL